MLSSGQKLKITKRCEKRFYDHIEIVVCEKTDPRNTKYSKNDNSLKMAKIGHDAWAIPMQNAQFGSKIKSAKKVRKTIV